MNIVIDLEEKGSRFINDKTDIFMPPITHFNHNILNKLPVVDKTNRGIVFTSAFLTKFLEVSKASI